MYVNVELQIKKKTFFTKEDVFGGIHDNVVECVPDYFSHSPFLLLWPKNAREGWMRRSIGKCRRCTPEAGGEHDVKGGKTEPRRDPRHSTH